MNSDLPWFECSAITGELAPIFDKVSAIALANYKGEMYVDIHANCRPNRFKLDTKPEPTIIRQGKRGGNCSC